ncbi:hypothetical protein [Salinisphaera sp.]|uniref:hypothetical protein n=1 Tax=Salinisphaera sp. TaxID=1914330 RepID=UPI002D7893C2|nr:hypothetical protein [Salinisphaera sp.]HET7314165.1 hypothetical protein [Salinisphaera sp.]
MPRGTRARLFCLLTAAVSIFAAGPALAQGNGAAAPSVTGQFSQPMQNTPGRNVNDGNRATGNQPPSIHNTLPSETLPEPKASDYGASTFNAPSDAELDLFAATHRPPRERNDRNGRADATTVGNRGGANTATDAAAAPDGNSGAGPSAYY